MAKLTQAYVDKVKWKGPSDRDTHTDDLLPGFYLIVTKEGHKSFSCIYRIAGKQRKLTIGNAAKVELGAARGIARQAFAMAAGGVDMAAQKKADALAAQTAPSRAFRVAAKEYLKRRIAGQRTAKETEQAVEKLIALWGDRSVDGGIGKADILEHLDEIQDAGHDRARDRRRQLIRNMWEWFIERGLTEKNPTQGVKKLQKGSGKKRQRILSDDELRAIWNAAGKLTPEGANCLSAEEALTKLLMILGPRRSEVAEMQWREVDAATKSWVIRDSNAKSELAQLIPLPQMALDVLAALPHYTAPDGSQRPFAITNTAGETAFSSFSDLKEDLDRLSGVTDWIFHDLRRTFRTRLTALGIAPDIGERCIGHVIGGVRAHYDLHEFEAEKRHAFDTWATALGRIVNAPVGEPA